MVGARRGADGFFLGGVWASCVWEAACQGSGPVMCTDGRALLRRLGPAHRLDSIRTDDSEFWALAVTDCQGYCRVWLLALAAARTTDDDLTCRGRCLAWVREALVRCRLSAMVQHPDFCGCVAAVTGAPGSPGWSGVYGGQTSKHY